MDPNRSFFNQLTEEEIESWVKSKESETISLEFKLIRDEQNLEGTKKHFCKTITAFANTNGGVVVWGVYCGDPAKYQPGKHSDNEKTSRDHVLETPGLKNPQAVREKINGWESRFIDPAISLVEHRVVGKFLATYVPSHPRRPFQPSGSGTYYMRAGSSSVPMPHTYLEALVLSRERPNITLHILPGLHLAKYHGKQSAFAFEIRNESAISLEEWMVEVYSDVDLNITSSLRFHPKEETQAHNWRTRILPDQLVAHFPPLDAFKIFFSLHSDSTELLWERHLNFDIKLVGKNFLEIYRVWLPVDFLAELPNKRKFSEPIEIPSVERDVLEHYLRTGEIPERYSPYTNVWFPCNRILIG